jgi:hypothetical protein
MIRNSSHCHQHQERRNRDRTGQEARQCLNCLSTRLELFTCNSSQKEELQTRTATGRPFAILRNSVRHMHPESWRRKNCLFLHDSAPAHPKAAGNASGYTIGAIRQSSQTFQPNRYGAGVIEFQGEGWLLLEPDSGNVCRHHSQRRDVAARVDGLSCFQEI